MCLVFLDLDQCVSCVLTDRCQVMLAVNGVVDISTQISKCLLNVNRSFCALPGFLVWEHTKLENMKTQTNTKGCFIRPSICFQFSSVLFSVRRLNPRSSGCNKSGLRRPRPPWFPTTGQQRQLHGLSPPRRSSTQPGPRGPHIRRIATKSLFHLGPPRLGDGLEVRRPVPAWQPGVSQRQDGGGRDVPDLRPRHQRLQQQRTLAFCLAVTF